MIVRKIKPEELKRTNELFAIAFEFEMDNTKSAELVYEETISNPDSRDNIYCMERWAAFEDDDKTMISNFVATPFTVQFDGQHCNMVGIGGVATLPQYRRMGGVRECFRAALPDMYEKGIIFSYLYPFSTAYYRKFGYEMCCERYRYHIKLSAIRPFSLEGNCCLVENESPALDDIKQIYSVWQEKYNMMTVNEEYEYAWVKNSNPVKDQRFTYVYKNKDGIAKGFMTFFKEDSTNGRNLKCSRFFFTDAEGFYGLLNLAYTCSSDHQYITFELPTDLDISLVLPEWSMGAGQCEKVYCGMARVINAKKVLEMANYRGSGSLVIKITDTLVPENNNTFYLRFENGAALEVSTTEAPADISLGITDFSRLIIGACDTSAIPFMDSVYVYANLENIANVFYKKPTLITQSF
jgi:predicted acetyltransferase